MLNHKHITSPTTTVEAPAATRAEKATTTVTTKARIKTTQYQIKPKFM